MKIFLVIACTILVASGAPHNQSPLGQSSLGSSFTSVQAVTTQLSSSTPSSQPLRASASIQQPLYSVPASLLAQNSPPQQEYNSVVPDTSYSHSHINPVLQAYGPPQPQQQHQSSGHQQQLSSQQPLSYNQYQTLLENGNPQLHSTPFHVSNDYSESTVPENTGNGDQKQTVVIHKHIHMHYFVRGAELPDLPPVPEEKTFVYVLLKKPDGPPSIVFPTQVPTKPTKPEVYFIQYKDPKNKSVENKQAVQQSGPISSSSQSNNNDSSSNISPPVPSSQYGARIAKSAPS
ncbi:unnamed protein product [Allacma fusca]|uniref:DUF243 domain-containing protein n=1 Tax=Allacma fusca TaxID=39272 RepID=A0A8J2KZ69_9HEXA|nr:unnamed protein product [Allacma fusca]